VASARDRLVSLGWPFASNRYVNHLLGLLAPEASFLRANSWPGNSYRWTERPVTVCLSFDCDTPEDGEALPDLLDLLDRFDLQASFAVVGELAEGQQAEYARIVESGHEVLNHGYSMHTEALPGGGHKPTGFYPDYSWDRIETEIASNQESLERLLGIRCTGFRTPHFGTFQAPGQTSRLYDLLAKHGLKYSSSVLMWQAKRGGYMSGQPVIELPLSARVGPPVSYFDSWRMVAQAQDPHARRQLLSQWVRALDVALAAEVPVMLNVYFDPSHVTDSKDFGEMLEYVAGHRERLWIGTYGQIVSAMLDSRPVAQ